MSTKEQHSKLIQGLHDYLDNTSPEQLEQDWKELEKFNQYGPDIEECLNLGEQHCIEMMKEEDESLKMEKTNKLKGWFGRLFCKHDYIYLGKHTRMKYTCSDWYYHTVAMYQCNKCGKLKKKVINWK